MLFRSNADSRGNRDAHSYTGNNSDADTCSNSNTYTDSGGNRDTYAYTKCNGNDNVCTPHTTYAAT